MNKVIYLKCLVTQIKEGNHLKNVKMLLKAREDVLDSFNSKIFTIMSDTTPYATPKETSINEDFLPMRQKHKQ